MRGSWVAALLLVACHEGGTDRGIDAASDDDARSCPASYIKTIPDTSSKYRIELAPVSWEVAAADCADDGPTSHLVVFGSEAERAGVFTSVANGIQIWVGFTDRKLDGSYQWITAEGAPTDAILWGTNEPDELVDAYDCARLLQNGAQYPGSFEMRSCATAGARYVCECDEFANDPSRY